MKGWREHHLRTLQESFREDCRHYWRLRERRYAASENPGRARITAAERRATRRHLDI